MSLYLFSGNGEAVINEIADKTSSIGYIMLSAFSGIVGLLLMVAAIYTGVKIVYSTGEKRKSNINHMIIIMIIFIIIVVIFAIGVNFAVDISKKAASGIS
ncbi:Mbov_0395 family pilin-like conjugal transfer protein [Mycoplasma procyoni]|uniref:Mbov_0395 family pilin-like conjugal transfer protein n=1 Tax=Mycoplasma procyoni TaxID=568784 RepID=UPI001F097A40|nr:hypothetical protein [Mycoplasma procyoni]